MKDELFLAFGIFPLLLIKVHLLPARQDFGFFFGQPGFHGEPGFGQKNRRLVIDLVFVSFVGRGHICYSLFILGFPALHFRFLFRCNRRYPVFGTGQGKDHVFSGSGLARMWPVCLFWTVVGDTCGATTQNSRPLYRAGPIIRMRMSL